MIFMYFLCRRGQQKTVQSYQDSKTCCNNKLAAIWFEGKIINTANDNGKGI